MTTVPIAEPTIDAFTKVVRPGAGADGPVYVKIGWDGRRLSISGVEGPMRNGDCRGGAGQITDALTTLKSYAAGWSRELAEHLAEVWQRWHLNDMRACCEHQRDWPVKEHIAVGNQTKARGWVRTDEHPDGLLAEPCKVCGYRYGSAWLHEEVPADVLEFLKALPDTDRQPAWV